MNRFAVTLFLLAPAAGFAQNRMPPIPADKLTPEQKKVIELVTAPPRGPLGSTGPFIPLLRSPELMNRLQAVGDLADEANRLARVFHAAALGEECGQ